MFILNLSNWVFYTPNLSFLSSLIKKLAMKKTFKIEFWKTTFLQNQSLLYIICQVESYVVQIQNLIISQFFFFISPIHSKDFVWYKKYLTDICMLWFLPGSRKNTYIKYFRLSIIWNLIREIFILLWSISHQWGFGGGWGS